MPKMKSHSGAKKRFSFTGTGKVRYRKSNRAHILSNKTTKQKRHLREDGVMAEDNMEKIKAMLPYGG